MNLPILSGRNLATVFAPLSLALTSGCMTPQILPKFTNINTVDAPTSLANLGDATCLKVRVRGFNPGILPLLGFKFSKMTKTDPACQTTKWAGMMLQSDDMFIRTVGFETSKLLPPAEQQKLWELLSAAKLTPESVARTVPTVEETIIENGMIYLNGHMPDGTYTSQIKPVQPQPSPATPLPANQP